MHIGDNNKTSPLDTKWTYKTNSIDKRKTVDDTHTGVSLRLFIKKITRFTKKKIYYDF